MTNDKEAQGHHLLRQPFPMVKLQRLLGHALENAWDVSTQKTYHSHSKLYLQFVKSDNLNLESTEDNLALFIIYMSNHIKPTSVETYLTGIVYNLSPFYPSVQNTQNSPYVKQALQGCLKLYNSPTHYVRLLSMSKIEKVSLI